MHARKAAKKVAAAAVKNILLRYATPVRTSGRERSMSAKAQGSEYANIAATIDAAAADRRLKPALAAGAVKHRETTTQLETLLVQRGDRKAIEATHEFQKKPVEERLQLALTAEEAIAQAAAEGLPLVRLAGSKTGFKSVYIENMKNSKPLPLGYVARLWLSNASNGKMTLGYYATAEEAALNYARCLGKDAAIAAAEGIEAELTAKATAPQLTRSDVLRQAAEEGLELIRSAKCGSGYRGVVEQRNGWWGAQDSDNATRTTTWLGNFRLIEEAALAYARFKAGIPAAGPLQPGAPIPGASNGSARRAIAATHGVHLARTGKLRAAEVEAVAVVEGEDDADGDDAMLVDALAVRLV